MTASRFAGRGLAAAGLMLAAVAFSPVAWAVAWDLPKDGLRPIPPLTAPVTDLSGTLSASDVQALDAKLLAWQTQTSNQLAVLMVPTTSPEAIEDYSIRVAEAWKIGQKGKDNGAIFLIAKDDKRMRIEVGYGFEGVLTDVTSRRIIAEDVAPEFTKGNWGAGINAGVDRIIAVTATGEPLEPVTTQRRGPAPHKFDFGTMFIVLLVAAPILGGILRSIFGKLGGSVVGGGIVGGIAWFIAASLAIAGIAGVVGFLIILFSSFTGRGGPGIFIPGGGGGGFGGGFGGGGGGFSGGGGGFGGGGASGGWN